MMNTIRTSKRSGRVLIWFLPLVICLLATSLAGEANSRFQDPATGGYKELTVRISAKKKRLHPGETLELHVEIWNEGTKDIFIPKEIGLDSCAKGKLSIDVQPDPQRKGPFSVSDCGISGRYGANSPDKPPLANVLSYHWIALPPDCSYGRDLEIYPLPVPGRYRIRGTYTSRGFSEELRADYEEEIKHLPYEDWGGEVQTNSIWIEVVKPTRRKK